MKPERMEYPHVRKILYGLVVLWIGFQQGLCIRCFSCDVTSSSNYAEANDDCNAGGMRDCANPEDNACMLEGFLRETNSIRVMKRCMRGCPLYINTTAEVVRCCTEDGCNAKFEPVPARRPPLRQPPRGYNERERERERGGYNVPMQGTNRPYNQNNIVDLKHLEPGGPTGGRFEPKDNSDLGRDIAPIKSTALPAKRESVTEEPIDTASKGKDIKFNPRDKPGLKKFAEKKMHHDRNSLAEQKLKRNDSAKMTNNGGNNVVSTSGVIIFTLINISVLISL